jgi:hypothetical protein
MRHSICRFNSEIYLVAGFFTAGLVTALGAVFAPAVSASAWWQVFLLPVW